jgi:hypothetical protein
MTARHRFEVLQRLSLCLILGQTAKRSDISIPAKSHLALTLFASFGHVRLVAGGIMSRQSEYQAEP